MFTPQLLNNLIVFMKRVPTTGEEAIAWNEAYAALNAELEKQKKDAEG